MISTKRYFINIDNGSIVPWTSEIEGNYKFKEITVNVAMAVERGRISAKEVIKQITKQITTGSLEEMLDAKLKMNVREGELNLEAQVKEDNTQKDTGEAAPFAVSVPADGGEPSDKPADTPAKTEKSRKPAKKNAGKPADAPADEAEKVAAALGDDAGLSGGVNV